MLFLLLLKEKKYVFLNARSTNNKTIKLFVKNTKVWTLQLSLSIFTRGKNPILDSFSILPIIIMCNTFLPENSFPIKQVSVI